MIIHCCFLAVIPEEEQSVVIPNLQDASLQDTDWYCRTFQALMEDPSTHDVTFKTSDGGSVSAHRVIVAAGSPVFHAMLYGNMKESSQKEIELPNIGRVEVLRNIITFMYLGKCQVHSMYLVNTLCASHYFNIQSLETKLTNFLAKSLDKENVLQMVVVANERKLDLLLNCCEEYILENGRNLITKFKELPFDTLLRVCKSSDLYVKEVDLFLAIVEWQQVNFVSNSSTSVLFQAIRYPLISRLDLISKVRPTGLASQDLYLAALEFHHFPSMYNGPEEQTVKRKYQYYSELNFTNGTPGNTSIAQPSTDSEGVVITKFGSSHWWDSLCVARIHVTEKYPLHFKFILRSCNSLYQGIEVGVRTCPTTNITPYHSNGIDMVGINTDEEMDGKVVVNGSRIIISLGEKVKHISKTHDEIHLCVHMYSCGSVQIWEQ